MTDGLPTAMPRKSGQHVDNRTRANRFDVPTVLIVEDNLALADAVAEVLHSIGYCALVAHDGEAALAEGEAFHTGGRHRRPRIAGGRWIGGGPSLTRGVRQADATDRQHGLAGQRRDAFQSRKRGLRRRAHQADLRLSNS